MLNLTQLYDETYYINQNQDVAEAVSTRVFGSGFEHFINFGKFEGRDPSIFFDAQYYLEQNADVAGSVAAGVNSAIEHFINFGQLEGRNPIFEFSTDFYLGTYPDVATAVAGQVFTPYRHFVELGLFEDRAPGFGFDRLFYLANNPDVAAAVNAGQVSAIQHYLTLGKAEGRLGSPTVQNLTTQNPPMQNLTTPNPSRELSAAIDLGILESTSVTGGVGDFNPTQFYRFTLDSPSDFSLFLYGLTADADVRLLQDVNQNNKIDFGEVINRSMRGGSLTESIDTGLSAGTYFVAIEQFLGNTSYNLSLRATPRTNVNPDSVGNTLSEAFNLGDLTTAGTLPINTILANRGLPFPEQVEDFDPIDIYSFSIAEANQFRLVLDGLSADADVEIAIDRNQDRIISFDEIIGSSRNWGAQPEEISVPNLFPGEYYIIVEQFEGDTFYNLTVETTPLQFPLSEAVSVGSLNDAPQSVIGFLNDVNQGDTYNFSINTPSDIQLNLGGLNAAAELYLIQDVSGNGFVENGEILSTAPGGEKLLSTLSAFGEYNSDSEAINFLGLPAGNYFVSVNRFLGDTNYNLSLSATPATSNFNTLFGYGLVDAAAAVARALGEPALAPVPDIISGALRENTSDLNLINAPAVWNRGFTGEGIVVAVLDDGVDWTHPDLANNIRVNPNEIAGNGIDDDGNGFVDDVRGWDFIDNDNNPSPSLFGSHGTHVAGTIAAQRNGLDLLTDFFSVEMNGVAYNATIMPIRVLGGYKSLAESDQAIAAGIRYAVENGANILQMSLGNYPGDPAFPLIEQALAFARERGVVAVISSGNERDTYGATRPDDPAFSARNDLAIAVGAVNRDNEFEIFSNPAGPSPLDFIVGPGVDVLSTFPNEDYQFNTGTSMATPHVSGVVALMLEANPNLTPAQVEQILIETAQPAGITLAVAEI